MSVEIHERILEGMRMCVAKNCRKCEWRDKFSGGCTLLPAAAKYVELLEHDNAKKMVYCKNCIYCKVTPAKYSFESDKYECTNREGLPIIPAISAMDFCSRGKAKMLLPEPPKEPEA